MSLEHYGWNARFEQHYTHYRRQGLEAGRVTAILGYKYILAAVNGTVSAELSGALLNGKEHWELPKAGDWVVFKAYEEQGYIIDVLPRYNELSRKLPGKTTEKQVLAANVDVALIVQGLDQNFNLMRLQRYLQQVRTNGIVPIIILTKKDLVSDPASYLQQVHALGYDCAVLAVSAPTGEGLAELRTHHLREGCTYALLGSSGAGKSTLMNALLGYTLQQEGALSAANNKGRHTTTTRHLVRLPNGSLVIDAPGMREFGLTIEEGDAVTAHHPQIAALAARCRFSDCTHQHEPGCAVSAAVENDELPKAVYASYLKLFREQLRYSIHAADKKRHERQFGKITRQVKEWRKRRKY